MCARVCCGGFLFCLAAGRVIPGSRARESAGRLLLLGSWEASPRLNVYKSLLWRLSFLLGSGESHPEWQDEGNGGGGAVFASWQWREDGGRCNDQLVILVDTRPVLHPSRRVVVLQAPQADDVEAKLGQADLEAGGEITAIQGLSWLG